MISEQGDSYDLLIIGGGVIGLSVAWHTARQCPGWRIALADRPTQSGQASYAAAGMLAPEAEFPPHKISAPGGDEKGMAVLRDLCRASRDYYPQFLQEVWRTALPGRPLDLNQLGWRANGALLPALNGTTLGEHGTQADCLMNEGRQARFLASPREAAELVPGLGEEVLGGLWLPEEATINSRALLATLRLAVEKQGAQQFKGVVEAAEYSEMGGNWTLTLNNDSENKTTDLNGRRLLVAAGSWSAALGEMLGVEIPVEPMKGQLARIEIPAEAKDETEEVEYMKEFLRPVLHTHEVYIAPRTGQGAIIGATMEHAGFDVGVESDTIQAMLNEAARLLPLLKNAEIKESWAGLRPRPKDGLPILGPVGDGRPLWLATGHFRNGILLTPITGVILSHLLANDSAKEDTDVTSAWNAGEFSYSRFNS